MRNPPLKILIADEFELSLLSKLPTKKFSVVYKPGISNDEIISSHQDSGILIVRSTRKVNKHLIDNLSLQCIATVSRGFDHINTDYAKKKNIKIIHCIKSNAVSTAEHTIGLIIALMRDFKKAFSIKPKNFRDVSNRRNELNGKTLGIVGFGNVGKLVYKYAKVFGMNIIVNDIDKTVRERNLHVNFTSLKKLLRTSDIISIHIPLNKSNHHFFNEEKLSQINKDSLLINTSRGEVIDEKVLIEKLINGKLRAAALDVLENENNPSRELFKIKNLTITNHIAGKTQESKSAMALEIVQILNSAF